MELIDPKVEYWEESPDYYEHIAKCAAVCYRTLKYSPEKMYEHLERDGHHSMFRHASHYFIVPRNNSEAAEFIMGYKSVSVIFGKNPYFDICSDENNHYVSTNHQYLLEHDEFRLVFCPFEVSRKEFAKKCPNKDLLRFTFCITCSIKVSRELNRVSPNNIAEQSTRYVNFNSKIGDVQVCRSVDEHLDDFAKVNIISTLDKETNAYKQLIELGVKPEDARRVLPLDTATVCAYTYNAKVWKHIIDLRYFETTGKAAPDAKVIGKMLYDEFVKLGYYNADSSTGVS